MLKSLAQLKRDISLGDTMILTWSFGVHKFLSIPRYVIRKQIDSVCLAENKNDKRGSWLDLSKASLIDYEDNIVRVYDEKLEEVNNWITSTGKRGKLSLVYTLIRELCPACLQKEDLDGRCGCTNKDAF